MAEGRQNEARPLPRYLNRWDRDVAEWGEQAAREMRSMPPLNPPVGADDESTGRGRTEA